MEYTILEADSSYKLQEKVRSYIGFGYTPLGSVQISKVNTDPGFFGDNDIQTTYSQAMTREGG